jgi:hypothetical protein
MIRTRLLHARSAYVMRVDNRVSVAYAAPPVARGFVVKNVDAAGLRIARLAYVMHYSLGTQAHMMRSRRLRARLCARLEKVFGARPNPATITYNAKASVLAARQHVLQSLMTRFIATPSLVRCICQCTVKLRGSVIYGLVQ